MKLSPPGLVSLDIDSDNYPPPTLSKENETMPGRGEGPGHHHLLGNNGSIIHRFSECFLLHPLPSSIAEEVSNVKNQASSFEKRNETSTKTSKDKCVENSFHVSNGGQVSMFEQRAPAWRYNLGPDANGVAVRRVINNPCARHESILRTIIIYKYR